MTSDGGPTIALDLLAFDPEDGGFASAALDLLRTCEQISEFDFTVVHHPRHQQLLSRYRLRRLQIWFPYRLRFFAGLFLGRMIMNDRHFLAWHSEISALPHTGKLRGSVTVHDVHFLLDRGVGKRSIGGRLLDIYWRKAFVASVRRAHVIKAISETTNADVREYIQPRAPILTVYPQFRSVRPTRSHTRRPVLAQDDTLRVIFIGSIIPRKNIGYLLDALSLVRRPWTLDVVGAKWWGKGAIEDPSHSPRIRVHGRVPDAQRDELLMHAHLLVLPSLYEGFGYPVGEAIFSDVAALVSDIPTFREIAPSEARFDLGDPGSLARKLEVMDEEGLRKLKAGFAFIRSNMTETLHIDRHRQLFHRLLAPEPIDV